MGLGVAAQDRVEVLRYHAMVDARLRERVKQGLQAVVGAGEVPRTSRTTLLALSELARRIGGDVPGGGTFRDLAPFELRVFSQVGEDGVIAEILRRCGIRDGYFVEFGAETGVETNSAVLADLLGWGGLYIEGSAASFAALERRYRPRPDVTTVNALVTPDNVEALFDEAKVPEEPDVLSMDVDGSEYWIWEAIERRRPRVVVVEYNAALDPQRRLVQARSHPPWDKTDWLGASIGALRALGERKGYRLVHCELSGNNAFFVRSDLPGDFPEPDAVTQRAPNFFLLDLHHRADPQARPFVDLDA